MKQIDLWISRIALLWAGILVGCSFIATPVKFQAPSLSLPTALEIGRVTFRSMAGAELILILIGAILLLRSKNFRSLFWWAILVYAIQWLAIMPFLNHRTDMVVNGQASNGPPWHVVYIVLELLKLVLLCLVAFRKMPLHEPTTQANL